MQDELDDNRFDKPEVGRANGRLPCSSRLPHRQHALSLGLRSGPTRPGALQPHPADRYRPGTIRLIPDGRAGAAKGAILVP
jgi:hypothetical protein